MTMRLFGSMERWPVWFTFHPGAGTITNFTVTQKWVRQKKAPNTFQ